MPSTVAASLTLVLPGFGRVFGRDVAQLPSLAKILAYCDHDARQTDLYPSHQAWQSELLRSLNLDATPAVAPLCWLGASAIETVGEAGWLLVQPVSLAVGAHGLSLQSLVEWSHATRRATEAAVKKHLAESGFEWREAQDCVFLRSASALQVQTKSLDAAVRGSLHDALPMGPDSVKLRRLMTELQMLLHDRSNLDFNALWLWGNGSIRMQKAVLPKMAANEAYVRGLCIANQAECLPLPANAEQLMEFQASIAVVPATIDALDRDWLAPSLRALQRGRLRSLHLYLDGYALHAEYSLRRRWFGRPRPLELP